MRIVFSFLCVLSISVSVAAHAQQMTPQQMQQMQQMLKGMNLQELREQAEKVRECMDTEGKEAMERLSEKNEATSKEVQALCRAGKRDQAQALAIKLGKEISASDDMKTVRSCTRHYENIPGVEDITKEFTPLSTGPDGEVKHICDSQ